ncbi:oligosaccharide flippase family protein [Exiguobacterium sp. s144]|uniref:oligosaccharide flippase family protein n=1 Tax=Exiguobacterium sp. s144 TaxID=2751195 RepID=UPI001BEB5B24|nr:oligosaccharide flippase family protein [Exiguobacterium sp. s144]
MVRNIFKNIGYNIIYQILVVIIPFLTIPYLTRIFSPETLGLYSYIIAICSIFMIIGQFGILNYGAKEIAVANINKQNITNRFLQLWIIQIIMTTISLVLYFSIIFMFFESNLSFFLINSLLIFSVFFDISWVFIGLEKLNLVLFRNIVVKIITLISIFVFVNSESDIYIYFLINIVSTLTSFIVSFNYLFKIMSFSKGNFKIMFKEFNYDFKNTYYIFLPHLLSVFYLNGDRIVVQYLSNLYQVGLYDQSQKVLRLIVTLITSCNFALVPFFSKNFSSRDDKQKSDKIFYELMNVVLIVSSFLMILFYLNINEFVSIFFDEKYVGLENLFKIGSIQIVFAAMSMFISQNYLIINNKQKYLVPIMLITIGTSLIASLLLIPKYGAIGGMFTIVIAEFISLILHVIYLKKSGYNNSINLKWGISKSIILMLFGIIILFGSSNLNIENSNINNVLNILVKSALMICLSSLLLFKIFKNKRSKYDT